LTRTPLSVSILIPCCRAQPFVARAVRSVLSQTVQDFEIVIVSDDGDDYGSVLSRAGIEDHRLRFTSTGGVATGLSHARKTGLAAASREFVAVLDADDVFLPTKLARMLPLAAAHGCCSCALRHVRSGGDAAEVETTGTDAPGDVLDADGYLAVNFSGNAMLIFDRRRVPGGWRVDLPVLEDIVFAMAAFNTLDAIAHVTEPLHVYTQTPASLSQQSGAAETFIATKERMIDLLDGDALGVARPAARRALRRFLSLSLAVEHEHAAVRERGEHLSFTDLMARRLRVP
jgi:glycosyltransferase involved in cell wall biosynthesis